MDRIKIRFLFFLFLLFNIHAISGQKENWPIKEQVQTAFASRRNFTPEVKFQEIAYRINQRIFHLNQSDLYEQLVDTSSTLLSIEFPLDGALLNIDFVKVDLGTHLFTENATTRVTAIDVPLCFRGVDRNLSKKHNVVLTVNKTGLSMTLYLPEKTISLVPMQELKTENRFNQMYRLIDQAELVSEHEPDGCGVINDGVEKQLPTYEISRAPQDKCVYVFVECFDSLYQNQNSNYQQTINYVYELFNHVASGYWNELINLKISAINVWTTTDPYGQASREQALADLSAFYQDDYWGNICVGLDFSTSNIGRSGIAGDIGRVKGEFPNVCGTYTVADHSFCYNDMNYNVNVQDFPSGPISTQQQVYLVMHEIGHLLGSFHTQWCGWNLGNGNFGALDNCAATEGGCAPGPNPGLGGGTIMSYCVGAGQSTSFNNGFGALPGAAVRTFVDNNACISNCPTCQPNISINFSNVYIPGTVYHYEASNTISAIGTLIASEYAVMDAGTRITLSPGFKANAGSNVHIVVEGCGGIR